MPNEQKPQSSSDNPQADSGPPPTAAKPPVIAAPPPLASGSPAPPPSGPARPTGSVRPVLAILLSLCLGLFVADAVVSLLDDTLILFFGIHLLAGLRGLVYLFALLLAIVVYVLMGLTPMIPKRLFLPVTLFNPLGLLAVVPVAIYFYSRIQLVSWIISLSQVILGLGILWRVQGAFAFRWPLVPGHQLTGRRFSWLNLSLFLLVNLFVLPPVLIVYLVLCTSLAIGHFSEGFVALRPGGLTVQVRKYIRDDGKTIQLVPMAHVADRYFYRKLSQSFPTNSIILMEGVTDRRNLLTNVPSYKRMANALGVAEQEKEFNPTQGEMVMADVDLDQFSTNTVGLLNLIMFIHSKGVNAGTLLKMLQCSPPADVQRQLFDDLFKVRNRHLLGNLRTRLSESEYFIVPWGAAHMPEIAREIQKLDFRLNETEEYTVIRFRYGRHKRKASGKAETPGKQN